MTQATKEQLRRERTRAYEATLDSARAAVAVLVLLAKGREARAGADSLEEAFAATQTGDATPFPAAVWVALRQEDVDATVDSLVTAASEHFLIAAHEQLDEGYRLTTVEERRGLPDVELLVAQIAAFLQLPRDVVAITVGWGPDDPRTQAEIETLLDQRFGTVSSGASGDASARGATAALRMSSSEFTALMSLTPEQRGVLNTLVRQAAVVIIADERWSPATPGS